MATVYHLKKQAARDVLKALAATETTPILDSTAQGSADVDPADIPHEPVIIIVD